MPKRLAVVLLSSLALACAKDEARLRVTTPAGTFTRVIAPGGSGTATVPYEVANTGELTAYVPTCGGELRPSIDRWDGSSWVQYAGPYCLANQQWASARLVKGGRVQGTAAISEAGTYRIRFDYTTEHSETGRVASDGVEVR